MARDLTRKTISGKTNSYKAWRAEVVRLCDEQQISDTQRELVTEPMLKDGWKKNEFPAYFVSKINDLS